MVPAPAAPARVVRQSLRRRRLSCNAPIMRRLPIICVLFFSALLQAQTPPCPVCPPVPGRATSVCLSASQMAARIAIRRPIPPPGLNEPSLHIRGTVSACLCFDRRGKPSRIQILSGPPMLQSSVVQSLRHWTFTPVREGGRASGACGPLRIRLDVANGAVTYAIESAQP
jgi:hypothetical protein